MCTNIHTVTQIQQLNDYQKLKDAAAAIDVNLVKASQRVQLKMPKDVVNMLDREFPNVSRSKLLTQAALEILMRKMRTDNPELEQWVSQEQYDLDRMWTYLNQRDKL